MADQGVSPLRASLDLYQKPQSLFLVIGCASMIAGRIVDVCGKNCNQYANLVKIGEVFGTFFGFWDSGSVVQSAYAGVRDAVKTVGYDHYYKEMTREEIRGEMNNEMTTQVSPYQWVIERVTVAALKTFTAYVLAYELLGSIGAVKSSPSYNLKACGAASAIVSNAYGLLEEQRKIADGPILKNGVEKYDISTDKDDYRNLYDQKHNIAWWKKANMIGIKLISMAASLGALSEGASFLGKIHANSADLMTAAFLPYAALEWKEHFDAGFQMKQLEENAKVR